MDSLQKAFDSVPHEWILRSLKLFKVSPRVVGFLKHKMKNWKTQLILTYESGTLMSDNINIKREIFQGDSLSPLLFCISLIPISLELNFSGFGWKIETKRITHLFYMDDLKLYAKDDSEVERLLRTVKGFNDDIGMEFGLSKCAKAKIWSERKFISNLAFMSLVEFNTLQGSKTEKGACKKNTIDPQN